MQGVQSATIVLKFKSATKPRSMKKMPYLYLDGLGFRSIGKFLGVGNVSVFNRIKSFGKELASLHSEKNEIDIVELDEIHSYVGSKKTIVGFGLLLIDMGKDLSTSLLATRVRRKQKNFGTK